VTKSSQKQHTKEITALFADIAGFTRFVTNNKNETVRTLLSDFYSIAEKLAPEHSGRFTEITGDEVSMHFENPDNAIDTAILIRESFKKIQKKYHNIDVHIGIDTGIGITWHPIVNKITFPYVTGKLQIVATIIENTVSAGEIGISTNTLKNLVRHKFPRYKIERTTRKGLDHEIEYIRI